MNNRHIHLLNFLIYLKIVIFAHLSSSIFLLPQTSIQTFLIYEESSLYASNVRSNENWIGGWGICEICKNTMLNLLISTQKSYFCDNDTIYDHRHEISRNSLLNYHSQTNSTISFFGEINRANFAVRGPGSIYVCRLFLICVYVDIET